MNTIIKNMIQSQADFVTNPDKDFTRARKISFEDTLRLILSMGGSVLSDELSNYFNHDCSLLPSKSAFIQQRAKILPAAFEYIFKTFTTKYETPKLYKGYRLLGADGSVLNITHNPNDKDTYIQTSEEAKGFNQLHLNALFDLENKLYIDAKVQAIRKKNETGALVDMVDESNLPGDVILIADRGYESYNLFAHVSEKGWKYLIRVKDITSRSIASTLDLPDTDEFDETITLNLTRKQTNEIKANPKKYKFMPKHSRFDYFELKNSSFYELKFRIVRFKLTENTYETIITNLDVKEFEKEEIKELYHKRWGIETSFRELKYAIGLVNWNGKKIDFIKQEIFAKLTMYNYCEIITLNVVIAKKERKYDYQVNFTAAIRACIKFFRANKKTRNTIDVEELIRREILPIRKGRSDKRKLKTKKNVSFTYRVI